VLQAEKPTAPPKAKDKREEGLAEIEIAVGCAHLIKATDIVRFCYMFLPILLFL